MQIRRPKIIGTMKIKKMKAGNYAVVNDIKNAPNKILIPCCSIEHGEQIISKIKDAEYGDVVFF